MPPNRLGDIDVYYELAGECPDVLFVGGTGRELRAKPPPPQGARSMLGAGTTRGTASPRPRDRP